MVVPYCYIKYKHGHVSRIIQLILIFLVQNVLNAQEISGNPENNVFTIDDQTTIKFSIPKEKFYYSNGIDESTDSRNVQN